MSFQLNSGQGKGEGIPNIKKYKYKGMIEKLVLGNMQRRDP